MKKIKLNVFFIKARVAMKRKRTKRLTSGW